MTGVLEHHRDVRDCLKRRDPAGARYRVYLDRAVGAATDRMLISTAEHIAPFNVPDTVSFLLPQLLLNALAPADRLDLLLLGGALIPLDNRQLPRGFMLPNDAQRATFQLFPQRAIKTSPVMQPSVRCAPDSVGAARFFRRYPWLVDVLTAMSDPTAESFAAQMSRCMERIVGQWGLDDHPAPVVVRPLEEIARAILIELLEAGDPFLDRVLFDVAARHAIEASLRGVFCAWGDVHGSFLFWRAHQRRMDRLRHRGDCLVAGDGYCVRFGRAELLGELRARRLWPGVFLSLAVVSLLPGVPISGGPKQLRYYQRMICAAQPFLDAPRTASLSAFGYMCFDPSELVPAGAERPVAARGTGLDLAERPLDRATVIRQLEARAVRSLSSFKPLAYD